MREEGVNMCPADSYVRTSHSRLWPQNDECNGDLTLIRRWKFLPTRSPDVTVPLSNPQQFYIGDPPDQQHHNETADQVAAYSTTSTPLLEQQPRPATTTTDGAATTSNVALGTTDGAATTSNNALGIAHRKGAATTSNVALGLIFIRCTEGAG